MLVKSVKISREAQHIYSDMLPYCEDNSSDCELLNRLYYCMDVCQLILVEGENKYKSFQLPFDPVEDVIYHNEIDFSNCPSLEAEDGDIEIRFGALSRNPTTKRNNYSELIGGWKEAFGSYSTKNLKVAIDLLSTRCSVDEAGVSVIYADVLNKKSPRKKLSSCCPSATAWKSKA